MTIWLIILGGLLSVLYGVVTVKQLMAADAGSERMQEISGAVAEGAQAYLKRQYLPSAWRASSIFVVLGLLLGLESRHRLPDRRRAFGRCGFHRHERFRARQCPYSTTR